MLETILESPETPETALPLRLWTVAEYHRMAELGLLEPTEKVELIAGQIIRKMSPQRTGHAVTLTLIYRLFNRLFKHLLEEQVLIRPQLPISLGERSEPEPDLVLVMAGELRYLDHHPRSEEIYLIIEVADTTLRIDTGLKAQSYAEAGIADYWVLDLKNRQLRVYRKPGATGYQTILTLQIAAQISPLQFPEININIADLLPPT
ncbi:MAG: Uma2 family endonuclease [Coleofasciculaceae cyanobacterium SM2_1_6]|nr:Uma2 family endonuclease [Coleofasciculaceae cyanobacterium SM2_1_6]